MNTREKLVNRLVARTMKKPGKVACNTPCNFLRIPGKVVCQVVCVGAAQKLRR
jgi:hypothetical protein